MKQLTTNLLLTLLCGFAMSVEGRQMVQPLLDQPLRDTFIGKGGDGAWLLTGTIPSGKNPADFDNNDGIHLWTSADRQTWKSLGQIWSIERDGRRSPKSAWQLERRVVPANPAGPLGRAMTSPEIHSLKGTYWVTYSMNGQGVGLLKSTTGKPEGPYEDLGPFIRSAQGSGSLFADTDGAIHLLWGDGWIAPLKEDLSGLQGEPVWLLAGMNQLEPRPAMGGGFHRSTFGGPFLFKANDRYHLVLATWSARLGEPCHDAVISSAEKITGPYGRPVLFLNHSGETSVFQADQKTFMATCSGPDTLSNFRDRPGVVPLVWQKDTQTFMRQRCDHFTELGPWDKVTRIEADLGADPEVIYVKDGYYYAIASNSLKILQGTVSLFRSKDLFSTQPWERIIVSTAEKVIEDARWPQDSKPGRDDPDKVTFWEGSLMWHQDRLYIAASLQGLKTPGGNKNGIGLWRSAVGGGGPPYEFMGRIANNDGLAMFSDTDGKAYLLTGFGYLKRFKDDMTGLDESYPSVNTVWDDGQQINYDCGWMIIKVGGKYVKLGEYVHTSYCTSYGVADRIEGPYKYIGIAHPHGGNASLFQDKDGQWIKVGFGNTDFAYPLDGPDSGGRFLDPMHVEVKGGEVIIEPVWRRAARK